MTNQEVAQRFEIVSIFLPRHYLTAHELPSVPRSKGCLPMDTKPSSAWHSADRDLVYRAVSERQWDVLRTIASRSGLGTHQTAAYLATLVKNGAIRRRKMEGRGPWIYRRPV